MENGNRLNALKEWLIRVTLILLTAGILACAPLAVRGYRLYRAALNEHSIQESVETIRSSSDYVTLDQLPEEYIHELLQSEDKRFYIHSGIDPIAIVRAAWNDLKAGAYVQGGSTITQQLAKNMYFSFSKTMDRKFAELFMAEDLENSLTKDEILELYINDIYFGNGQYGIKNASEYYYGVEPKNLTSEQIDSLVYTIKCPNEFNPVSLGTGSSALSLSAD